MKDINEAYGGWALVTGASDGIGRAFAEEIAKRGMNLVLVARRTELLDELASELSARHHAKLHVITADLSTQEGVDAVVEQTESLDIGLFVAAAGFGTSGDFVDSRLADELNMLDVNCRAVVAHTHHMAGRFKARGRGGIILLASLVGFQGTPRAANYAATKAYVQCLAEGLRVELKPHNVDVLAVAPGPVASGFARRADMVMGGADEPASVARGALKALGKRYTARPGLLGKILGYSLCLMPRWGRIQIMNRVMGGMTRHQQRA